MEACLRLTPAPCPLALPLALPLAGRWNKGALEEGAAGDSSAKLLSVLDQPYKVRCTQPACLLWDGLWDGLVATRTAAVARGA